MALLVATSLLAVALPMSAITASATGTYATAILVDAPAIYYRLDEATGTVAADSSGSARNGTYVAPVTLGVAGALANESDAAFTPGTGYLQYAAGTGLPTGTAARSFEAWVSTTSTADQVLLGYGGNNPGYCSYLESGLGVTNGNRVTFLTGYDCNGGYSALQFVAPRSIADGQWHLVGATWDGTTVNAYLDGQSIGSQAYSASLGTVDSTGLLVGRESDQRRSLSGSIDEVAVYPSSLSATQVLNHFNASGNARPSAPGAPGAVAAANKATVSWTAATSQASAPVLGYRVIAMQGSTAVNTIAVDSTNTSAVVNGLQGGVAYTFSIQARNRFGWGPVATTGAITPTGAATTYASTAIGDHPVAYYRLDDAGTLAADSSGSGRDGYYLTGGTQGAAGALANDADTAWTAGTGAVQNGSANGIPTGTAARSFEAWVNTSSAADQVLIGYGGNNPAYCSYLESGLGVTTGNRITFLTGYDCNGGYSSLQFLAPRTFADGQWHMVSATWDGTTVTAYLDGQPIGSQAFATSLGTADSNGLMLGRESDSRRQLSGGLDEVAIYSAALTAAQALSHFNASGNTRPSAPGAPSAVGAANKATVSWTAATSQSNAPVLGYTVTARQGSTSVNAIGVDGGTTSTALTGLQGGIAYTFSVQARNRFGWGQAAVTAAVTPTGNTTYASTVIGDQPVAYYRLDDSGTLGADSSGGGRDASYLAGGTQGSPGALSNDPDPSWSAGTGAVQYLSASGIPTGTAARSFEAWVNTTSTADQVLIGYGGNNPNYCAYLESGLGIATGNRVSFLTGYDCNGGYSSLQFLAPRSFADGQWHMVSATWDGTTVAAYLDGQAIGTQAFSSTLGTADNSGLVLGRESDARRQLSGGLDEVAIYSAALTAAQASAHFDASGYSRPSAPSAPSAVAGANKVTVSWTAANTQAGAPVLGYTVTARQGSTSVNATALDGATTSTTISGLKGGVAYTFSVQARNRFGWGTSAATAAVTPSGATTTYASTVIGDQPRAYYRLSDSGTMTADSSGNARDANYLAGGTQGSPGGLGNDPDTSWAAGTGAVQYISAGGIPTGTASRSFEAWVNTTSTADQVLIGYGGNNPNYCAYLESGLGISGGNKVSFLTGYDCNGGYSALQFTASTSIADGHWHHLAATWNGSTVAAYLDGQALGTQAFSSTLGTADSSGVLLGRESDNRRQFSGSLDRSSDAPG